MKTGKQNKTQGNTGKLRIIQENSVKLENSGKLRKIQENSGKLIINNVHIDPSQ